MNTVITIILITVATFTPAPKRDVCRDHNDCKPRWTQKLTICPKYPFSIGGGKVHHIRPYCR